MEIPIICIVLISGLIALSRGLIKEVLSIVGWVLSGFAVVWLLPVVTKITTQYVTNGLIAGLLSAIFILILFMVIWILVTESFIGKIRTSKLNGLDRILGLFFGVIRAFLLIILVYILMSWCIPVDKQPEVMQKSKYYQIAGNFAKPIEDLIPQETLDLIKKKTDEYISTTEEAKEEKTEELKQQAAEELFNRLARPEIEKKKAQDKEENTSEPAKESFDGYNSSERENLERLIETVE